MTRTNHTAAIVISLAVGIAGTITAWSVIDRVFAFYHLGAETRHVWILGRDAGSAVSTLPSTAALREWQRDLRSFERISGVASGESALTSGTNSHLVSTLRVDPDFFLLSGVMPVVGRPFLATDPSGGVGLIDESLAIALFASVDAAPGKTITLDGVATVVIGVFSNDSVTRLIPTAQARLLIPLAARAQGPVQVVGLLEQGVSIQQSQSELDSWTSNQPKVDTDHARWVILSQAELTDAAVRRMILGSVVGGVLLIIVSVSNIGYLLVARRENRRKDTATRWALGATHWGFFRSEWRRALVLTLFAAGSACLLAHLWLRAMTVVLPEQMGVFADMRLATGGLTFAVCASWLVMSIASTPTVFRAPTTLVTDLRGDVPRHATSRLGRLWSDVYIIALVATALVLAVAAYLVVGTVISLGKVNVGFQLDGLEVTNLRLPQWKYRDPSQRAAFFDQLSERLATSPNVTAFGFSSSAPPATGVFAAQVFFGDTSLNIPPLPNIGLSFVDTSYFRTMEQPILAGRGFTDEEIRLSSLVVVISQASSKRFGGAPAHAIGQRIRFGDEWREVVGVVSDTRSPGLVDALEGSQAYWPLRRHRPNLTLVSRGGPASVSEIRSAVRTLDRDVTVESAPMTRALRDSVAGARSLSLVFSGLTSLAMILAIFGVAASLSGFVTRQRRVLALHLALGANSSDIWRQVLWKGLSKALAGIAIGIVLSYPFSRLLSGYLFQVEADSSVARLLASALLLGAIGAAAVGPAKAANRISPSEVLKQQ